MLLKNASTVLDSPHPAAVGIQQVSLDPLQVDCVTAQMLSIMDNRCKLNLEEQLAWMAIYHVVRGRVGVIFDKTVHQVIEQARLQDDPLMNEKVHELRQYAERNIPQPVMRHFRRYLAESLYGFSVESDNTEPH
jgi:hypothetical protein